MCFSLLCYFIISSTIQQYVFAEKIATISRQKYLQWKYVENKTIKLYKIRNKQNTICSNQIQFNKLHYFGREIKMCGFCCKWNASSYVADVDEPWFILYILWKECLNSDYIRYYNIGFVTTSKIEEIYHQWNGLLNMLIIQTSWKGIYIVLIWY